MSIDQKFCEKSTENSFSQQYRVFEEIGKGAFSVVYRCTKNETEEEFAVKVFKTHKLKKSDFIKIEKEYDICMRLNHKNIVKIYNMYHTSNCINIVFELIKGGELFDQLASKEFYSEREASSAMECILSTIVYCHNINVVHRDVKPENLLMATALPDSDIKLADFGLAFIINDDKEINYGFSGTPGYLAPEMLLKSPYGKPIDVWACGIVLYMLLVGMFPFYNDDQTVMFESIINDEVDLENENWKTISPNAKSLVSWMLNKEPKERPTAEEALDHDWIKNRELVARNEHNEKAVIEMKRLNAKRKLRSVVLSTIAAQKLKGLIDKIPSNIAVSN